MIFAFVLCDIGANLKRGIASELHDGETGQPDSDAYISRHASYDPYRIHQEYFLLSPATKSPSGRRTTLPCGTHRSRYVECLLFILIAEISILNSTAHEWVCANALITRPRECFERWNQWQA